jgi:anti-anti-sigma factor
MSLEIGQKEIKPGVVVVTLAGRVMLGKESVAIETLVDKGLPQGWRHFVFDLSGVTHIDSTGIGHFISNLNKVRQAGGTLRMAAASCQLREAFRVTRLDTVFEFFPDTAAALEGLG